MIVSLLLDCKPSLGEHGTIMQDDGLLWILRTKREIQRSPVCSCRREKMPAESRVSKDRAIASLDIAALRSYSVVTQSAEPP